MLKAFLCCAGSRKIGARILVRCGLRVKQNTLQWIENFFKQRGSCLVFHLLFSLLRFDLILQVEVSNQPMKIIRVDA